MLSFLFQRIAASRFVDEKPHSRRSQSTPTHRSRKLGMGMECLEHRALLSATTVEVEPNNSAATANIAQFDPADGAAQLMGSIANRKDRDFFQFTAPSSGSVQLAVHGDPGLVTKVEVENAQHGGVFETESHNGVDSGSFAVEAGQTYTLRVEGKDKTIGAYTVDLVLSDTAPPANGGADEQNEDGPNDPNHEMGDDAITMALATPATNVNVNDHGANRHNDRRQDRGNDANDMRQEDQQNDPNQDVGDDKITVAVATSATKVNSHGADRHNDHVNEPNEVNDVQHDDR